MSQKILSTEDFNSKPSFKNIPELRFPEFKDKYNSTTIKDVLSYSSSKLSINKLENNAGNYELYGAEGVVKYIDFYDMDEEYISIIKDGAVGRLSYCKPKTSIVGTMGYLTLKDNNFDLKYLFNLLSVSINLEKYVVGSVIPHIYFKDYSKEKIIVPNYIEQVKISQFLATIDRKISLIRVKKELMNKYKKGLLQKMFIKTKKIR